MKKTILMFTVLLLCSLANAKVLVISDIDDTLKVTNVRSKAGAASSFFDDTSRFAGMAEVFQALKKSHADIEFHYVSLAPKILMERRHKEFLQENYFPITALHTNPGIQQDPELKQKVIRSLLETEKPDLVVYFGDNGQFDTLVYRQMDTEFPQIPSVTYIREAYSQRSSDIHPVLDGQIGFVTSLEVTIDLIQKKILPVGVYTFIEQLVYKAIQADDGDEHFGKMVFPHWQDCHDLKWRWNTVAPTARFLFIKDAIQKRCQ